MCHVQEQQNLIKTLGFPWNNCELLATALTHTSFANENRSMQVEHNQRLEFLGDAVLELVISDYLFTNYPHHEEGVLTKIRAAVVCEPSLARVAQGLKLGQALRLGKGEERTGGRERPAALADAFEALVGAIYLDQGLDKIRCFILQSLKEDIIAYAQGNHAGDYKSELQEWIQQYTDQPLNYVILNEFGPDHNKTFTAGVEFRQDMWGTGKGRTKKEAEQTAASNALNMLKSQGNIQALVSGR